MGSAATIQADSFASEVLEFSGVVLVDFFGPGCAPCRALAPTIDALAEAFGQRAKVVKLDASRAPELASRYGVSTLPTLALFRAGEVVKTFMGVQSKSKLTAAIEENL